MIAPSVVQEVRRMLAGGDLSQRKIARLLGISRGTIGAIASGKRPDYESLQRAADDEPPEPSGPPRRCPGCGGMVYMPCRLCSVRAARTRSTRPPVPAWLIPPEEPLGLDLRDADRARYEEVRLRRANSDAVETGCEAERVADDPRDGRDESGNPLEIDDDRRVLEPAELWDAFDWDSEEPVLDYADGPDGSSI